MKRAGRTTVLVLGLATLLSGCPDFAALQGGVAPAVDGEAPPRDASVDEPNEAGIGEEAAAGTVYRELGDLTAWSAFDLSAVGASLSKFGGGVFDGKSLVLCPSSLGAAFVRFDTAGSFTSAASWTSVPRSGITSGLAGVAGSGGFAYFAPYSSSAPDGMIVRQDLSLPFAAASFKSFDAAALSVGAKGYTGAVTDGRYLYFVPYWNVSQTYHGVAIRYDTTLPYEPTSSWKTYDMTHLGSSARGFNGGAWDGRYVYYAPSATGPSSSIARYDSQGAFEDDASWSSFDLSAVNAVAKGFYGALFDGRFVTFVPNGHTQIARYDTKNAFGSGASWSFFDVQGVGVAVLGSGGAFDGRYLWFVPRNGLVIRYDTERPMTATDAWTTFDVTKVHPKAKHFGGAAFDGRYVYLLPWDDTVIVRFDAKNPPSLPKPFGGSFL